MDIYACSGFSASNLELSIMSDSKLTNLVEILKSMQSAVLAFSGGVDSTLLLKGLQISGIRALAVTGVSEITPRADFFMANKMAEQMGIEHRITQTDNMLLKEEFLQNTPERCFLCKDDLFKKIYAIASSEGYACLVDGSNVDDAMDYRPGMKAAAKYNVRSPLSESGLSKKEIRELSRQLALPTWDKPSSACLATRFPYGQRITKDALRRIEEAEEFLKKLGFSEVRVRNHDMAARIEVNADEIDLALVPKKRRLISLKLKSLGFRFVSIDLDGYRTGSLNSMIMERGRG